LLKNIFGNSPKTGAYQTKSIGQTVNLGGRAVIVPDARLDMDQVAIPEEMAWNMYRPFVMRRLVQRGYRPLMAAKEIEQQSDAAKQQLLGEMSERPVIINRAPSLHKFSLSGAWPVLTKNKALGIPGAITAGLGADFDGDTMSVHVPVSKKAVEEVKTKMMPSKELFSAAEFDKPMFLPRHEFQMGLWLATRRAAKRGKMVKYSDVKSVLDDFKAGRVNAQDVVDIPDKTVVNLSNEIRKVMRNE